MAGEGDRPALPAWDPGTVAILSTGGEDPHAIPVSTAVRAGDDRLLIALARRRESLARLRGEPRVALTLLAAGDIAVTAHCRARVLAEAMRASDRVAVVELDVLRIQDHNQPRFEIEEGCAGAGPTTKRSSVTRTSAASCAPWPPTAESPAGRPIFTR